MLVNWDCWWWISKHRLKSTLTERQRAASVSSLVVRKLACAVVTCSIYGRLCRSRCGCTVRLREAAHMQTGCCIPLPSSDWKAVLLLSDHTDLECIQQGHVYCCCCGCQGWRFLGRHELRPSVSPVTTQRCVRACVCIHVYMSAQARGEHAYAMHMHAYACVGWAVFVQFLLVRLVFILKSWQCFC